MSHIDDLQRLLDTDLAMEFLLRQCVKPLSSTHSASCHIILLGIGIHLCQATQSCINLADKISLYSDDLQRGFSKHTQNAHCDILHCAMLCDAVRCCAFVPWERKTWEQVGENGRYIHSCNSRWWRGECQLTCSFGWFLSGSTHCTFLWHRCNVFTLLMRMRPK